MSNNQLPADVESRLDAAVKRRSLSHDYASGYKEGYIAGATAENEHNESLKLQLEAQNANVEILLSQKKELIEKAQVLVDALKYIQKFYDIKDISLSLYAAGLIKDYEQWKGTGKEETKPEPEGCPYCGSATCTSDHK